MHASALRYLSAVADCRSIREASERLNISPSAVTRQIQKLEDEFGVRLFERGREGIRPTEAGRLVLHHARETLHEFGRLKGDIRKLSGVVGGKVTIATLNSLTVQFLPEVIADVVAPHSELEIRVVAGDPMEVTQLVVGERADLGLTFNAVESKGIRVIREMDCPFVAIMRPDHELAANQSLTLEQCSGHRLIYQDNSGPMRLFLGDEIESFRSLHSPVVTSNSLTLLKQLLLLGVGLAFYTRLGFVEELAAGKLVAVPLKCDRVAELRLTLMSPKGAMPTAAVRTVTESLDLALTRMAREVRVGKCMPLN